MKISSIASCRDYKYIRMVTLDALSDEKVGQGDGKGNINYHHFFGLLDLVDSKMSANGERIMGIECDIFREVFWDLFRDGYISLGNLESEYRGNDFVIKSSDEFIKHLSFPYFRVTDKFINYEHGLDKKHHIHFTLKSIPFKVGKVLKMLFLFIVKNLGLLISIVKGFIK